MLLDHVTGKTVMDLGPNVNERVTPCSSFKIVLSLMGYDAGVLKDVTTPTWDFREGYSVYLESWKASQTPLSWMSNSCVWYSQVLAGELVLEKIQNYLHVLDYGNQDMSGGLKQAWLSSSLKISPKEQVSFIQKMVGRELPVSSHAIEMTKSLLFKEELPGGWKLFGKTGFGTELKSADGKALEMGWFVGWIEKG